jgi:hypothetical protein
VNTPRKAYQNFRNNMAMLYKNLSGGSVFWVIAARLVLDGIAAAGYLVAGKPKFFMAVWQAHRDFFRRRPELRAARRHIQLSRVASPRFIYKGSIVLRYLIGRKRFGNMILKEE